MSVFSVNFELEQGTDFVEEFDLTKTDGSPLNLIGHQIAARVRKHPTAVTYEKFTITFINREEGKIKLSLTNTQTINLSTGRNYYDILIKDPLNRITKIVEGNIMVNEGVTSEVSDDLFSDANNVDASDGYVIMYLESEGKFVYVDPDKVLEKSVEDGVLPAAFINQLDVTLDDKIDVDAGEFVSSGSTSVSNESSSPSSGIGTTSQSSPAQSRLVLMYSEDTETSEYVDPDEVLSQSVQDDTLPEDFLNKLDESLDNRINLDAGGF